MAVVKDSVRLALLVVLDTLEPAEPLAFVLHDVFAVPFEHIASLVEQPQQRPASWPAGPAVESRPQLLNLTVRPLSGRWWTRSSPPLGAGPWAGWSQCCIPDVVLRIDLGPVAGTVVMGAAAVARRAAMFARDDLRVLPALVNGTAGVVITEGKRTISVMAFASSRAMWSPSTCSGIPRGCNAWTWVP